MLICQNQLFFPIGIYFYLNKTVKRRHFLKPRRKKADPPQDVDN